MEYVIGTGIDITAVYDPNYRCYCLSAAAFGVGGYTRTLQYRISEEHVRRSSFEVVDAILHTIFVDGGVAALHRGAMAKILRDELHTAGAKFPSEVKENKKAVCLWCHGEPMSIESLKEHSQVCALSPLVWEVQKLQQALNDANAQIGRIEEDKRQSEKAQRNAIREVSKGILEAAERIAEDAKKWT